MDECAPDPLTPPINDTSRRPSRWSDVFSPLGQILRAECGALLREVASMAPLSTSGERGDVEAEGRVPPRRPADPMRRALALLEQLLEHQVLAQEALAALDLNPWATLTLDVRGHVLHANAQAEGMLRRRCPIRLHERAVTAATDLDARVFDAALERCVATGIAQSARLRSPPRATSDPNGSATTYGVTFSRVPDTSGAAALARQDRVHCLISPLERRRVATVDQLMQVFDLTPAEARLARAIAHNDSLAAYCGQSGIKITTAKTQLRAALDKTGTRSQAELLRVVLAIPVQRAAPRAG